MVTATATTTASPASIACGRRGARCSLHDAAIARFARRTVALRRVFESGFRMSATTLRGLPEEFARHGLGTVLTENTAPCGSDITASREISVSNGGMIIAPPSFSALSAVASAGVGDPEIDAPVRRRGFIAARRHHHPDHVARHRLFGFAADVTRQSPERDLAELVGFPAEDLTIERLRALGVSCVEDAHRPRPRLIDDLGSPVLLRLPQTEDRPAGIGDDRGTGDIEEIERLNDDGSALVCHPRGDLVSTLYPNVGTPRGCVPASLRADRGDGSAAKRTHKVLAGRAGLHHLLCLPRSEERRVGKEC